ncbi:uncharacterized protein Dwil_GK28081 [Drosophila willistoni]|nr:uncharacterized protein Dwil_GK28081 [Drosophila willistoni]
MLALMYQKLLVILAFAWFASGAPIADVSLEEDPLDSYLRNVEDLFLRSYDNKVRIPHNFISGKAHKSLGG